jgi:hypothetical protein
MSNVFGGGGVATTINVAAALLTKWKGLPGAQRATFALWHLIRVSKLLMDDREAEAVPMILIRTGLGGEGILFLPRRE